MEVINKALLLNALSDWQYSEAPDERMNSAEYHDAQIVYDTLEKVWEMVSKLPEASQERVDVPFYDQEECYHNCTVQVLKNSKTGECSVGWWKNE